MVDAPRACVRHCHLVGTARATALTRLAPNPLPMTASSFETAGALAPQLAHHLLSTVGVEPPAATSTDMMHGLAQVAREQLSRRWVAGDAADRAARARRVYYLSMEFLIGRSLSNALAALDLQGAAAEAA